MSPICGLIIDEMHHNIDIPFVCHCSPQKYIVLPLLNDVVVLQEDGQSKHNQKLAGENNQASYEII